MESTDSWDGCSADCFLIGRTPISDPMADELVVEFQGVTKTYDAQGGRPTTAIRDITFQVPNRPKQGEFVSILGPSGCGKSTILRLIAGLRPQFPATTGTVKVMGNVVTGPGPDRGMVFQDYTS